MSTDGFFRLSEGPMLGSDAMSTTNQLITGSHLRQDYRPVVVGSIRDEQGRFLLVESAKGEPNTWGFLQGGIDPGEGLRPALLREAEEEVGIAAAQLVLGPLTDVVRIDARPGRSLRGFRSGKLYFVLQAQYTGEGQLTLDLNEVTDARWVDPDHAEPYLQRMRPQKRGFTEQAFSTVW